MSQVPEGGSAPPNGTLSTLYLSANSTPYGSMPELNNQASNSTQEYDGNGTVRASSSMNSLNSDNFINSILMNNANSTPNPSGSATQQFDGTSTTGYQTAISEGLRSLNATAHSLERHMLSEFERAQIRDQARDGYTEAARGRVHEELAPYRSIGFRENQMERNNDVGALIGAAGLVFGANGRTPFTGQNKQGPYRPYNTGERQAFPIPLPRTIIHHHHHLKEDKGGGERRRFMDTVVEKQGRPPTPDLTLYGLDPNLSSVTLQMRLEAEAEATNAGVIKRKGHYFVKLKLKGSRFYEEDVRHLRPWVKLLRPEKYKEMQEIGWLHETNEEKGLHELVGDLTKVEFILFFKLHSIMPTRLNPVLSPAASVADLLHISEEQKVQLDKQFQPVITVTPATPLGSPEGGGKEMDPMAQVTEVMAHRVEGSDYRRTLVRRNGTTHLPVIMYLVFDLMRTLTRYIVPLEAAKRWLLSCWEAQATQVMSNEEAWQIIRNMKDDDIGRIIQVVGMSPRPIPENEWHTGPLGVPLLRIHAGANGEEDRMEHHSEERKGDGAADGGGVSREQEEWLSHQPSTPLGQQQAGVNIPGHGAASLTGIGKRNTGGVAMKHPARMRLYANSASTVQDQGTEPLVSSVSKKRRAEDDADIGVSTCLEGLAQDRRKMTEVLRSVLKCSSRLASKEEENKEGVLETLQDYAESAGRKWERMEVAIEAIERRAIEMDEMKRIIEEKDCLIAKLNDCIMIEREKNRETAAAKGENRKIPMDELKRILDKGVVKEEWCKIAQLPWPSDAFTKTKATSEVHEDEIGNLVVISAAGDNEGNAQLLDMRIPAAVKHAIRNGEIGEGEYAKITKREITMVGSKQKNTDTTMYIASFKLDVNDVDSSAKNMTEALQKVMADMTEGGYTFCTRVKGTHTMLRKIVEMHGRATNTENKIWMDKKMKPKEPNPAITRQGYSAAAAQGATNRENPAPANIVTWSEKEFPALSSQGRTAGMNEKRKAQPPKRPVVIVKAEGRSIGDMTKAVRNTVGELGKKIVNAQMTRDGNFKIEVNNGDDARLIKEKLEAGALQAADRQPVLRVVLRGIQDGLTPEEVTEELEERGLKPLRVRLLPANKWGKRLAFCDLHDDKTARAALARGTVMMGYTSCPVRPYVESNLCYRCHEEGHHQQQCASTKDYSNCCRRCKKEGHIARDCKELLKEVSPVEEVSPQEEGAGHNNVQTN